MLQLRQYSHINRFSKILKKKKRMMKRAISLLYNWLNIGRTYSRLRHIGQDTGSFYAFGSLGSFYQLPTCASLVAHRVKNPHCRRPGLDPWVGKTPWRKEWLPTPVFLSREFRGQRSLAGYSQCSRRIQLNFHFFQPCAGCEDTGKKMHSAHLLGA